MSGIKDDKMDKHRKLFVTKISGSEASLAVDSNQGWNQDQNKIIKYYYPRMTITKIFQGFTNYLYEVFRLVSVRY